MTTFDPNKQARDTIGRFASPEHGEADGVALSEDALLSLGNRATMAVSELCGYEASDDGAGWYLLVESRQDRDSLHSSCPTFASDDPDAKWYVESSDGNFYKAHPDFGHDADPKEVSAWINETRDLYDAGLSADKATLKVQDLIEKAESHNDGDGIYLRIPAATKDEEILAGCPVSATSDPKTTWYVETPGGEHEDHPTYTHDTDPALVAAWIREVKDRYESAER